MQKRLITIIFIFSILITPVFADKEDPLLEYSKGNVPGHTVIEKFGHDEDVGGDLTTIWGNGTLYPWLDASTLFNLSSTDADDTLFGTGAWNVTIIGLDANYVQQEETIVLNGQTPVSSTLSYLRIFRMYVRKSGTTETNEGIIRAGTGPTAGGNPLNEYARISVNYGQSQMALYTVPANCTAYLFRVDMTTWASVVKRFEVYLIQRPFNESFRRMSEWNFDRSTHLVEKPFLTFDSRTDIEFRGEVSTGTGFISVIFDIVLVEDGEEVIDQVFDVNIVESIDLMSTEFFVFILIAITTMYIAWNTENNRNAGLGFAFSAVFWIGTMIQWAIDHSGTDEIRMMWLFIVPLSFCFIMFSEKSWHQMDDATANAQRRGGFE